jgi:hypothetical protein
MNRNSLKQLYVILALLATIIINGLANALPLNGLQTGEISDRFDVYFVPAGYVFSIWGLIYLALLAYVAYQARPAQRNNERLQKIVYLFVGSAVANIIWLFLWHFEIFTLSIFAMLAILACLIAIYLRLGIGKTKVSTGEKWFVHVPFSIYLGWITVATIANATSLLDYLNWSGWGIGPLTWTVIMLAAGTLIAGLMSFTRGDVAYSLVLMWAFSGIAIKHLATQIVATSAWAATVLVAVLLVIGVFWQRKQVSK